MSPKRRTFPNLKAAASEIGSGTLVRGDLRRLLCGDCDFYDDDHEEELECSCFSILCHLLATGELTPQGLAALLPDDEKGDKDGAGG